MNTKILIKVVKSGVKFKSSKITSKSVFLKAALFGQYY